jgi:hypothetical protein
VYRSIIYVILGERNVRACLGVNEVLDLAQPLNVFLTAQVINSRKITTWVRAYLLFLVLRVLGHEQCEAVVDPSLLEELLKLLLKAKVERLELVQKKPFDTTSVRRK